jgi:outer membrane murein-binding lipoprotein Lpp
LARKRSTFENVMWTFVVLTIVGLTWAALNLISPSPRKPMPPPPSESSIVETTPLPRTSEPAIIKPVTPKAESQPTPAPTPPPSAESAPACIEILKAQAVNAKEWALAPLDETVPSDIRQNLTLLREDLVDEGKAKPRAPIPAYSTAWQLCNALLAALERDKARVSAGYRAAQANANQTNTNQPLEAHRNYMMSWPQYARETDQRSELQRQSGNRVALAGEAQKVAWATRTAALRSTLDDLYAQFREALRQSPVTK